MFYLVSEESTLEEAVAAMAGDSSKTTCRSWIEQGRVTVNEIIQRSRRAIVQEGSQVALLPKSRFVDHSSISIVYSDEHLVVIDKPEGLLSVAANYDKEAHAHAFLKKHFRPKRVFVVHRLDQDTSGLMLFALSEEARDNLKKSFEMHAVQRSYVALVEGVVKPKAGVWRTYQYEDSLYKVHQTDDPVKGYLAISHYKVLKSSKRTTLLALELETGKKNQIRSHCEWAGYPILGDTKYGATRDPLRRLALHAHELHLAHPITKKPMHFRSIIPSSFRKILG